jgi:hypothetical protein
MFVFLNVFPINRPEVILPFAPKEFDSKGKLIDESKVRRRRCAGTHKVHSTRPGAKV